MTTTEETTTTEDVIQAEREQWAVSKDQLRKLNRFMAIGHAKVSTGLAAQTTDANGQSPGQHQVAFRLDTYVPFTRPGQPALRGQTPGLPQRLEAEGIMISSAGVHLLARPAPASGEGHPNAERRTRWVGIDEVGHVETPI